MTRQSIESQVGMSIWRLLIASATAISLLIGGILWLASIQSMARAAEQRSTENTTAIETMRTSISDIKIQLTESRVDIKYIIAQLDRLTKGT